MHICAHAKVHIWGSEDNLLTGLILFLHHMGPWHQTQVVKLLGRHLYLLSHLNTLQCLIVTWLYSICPALLVKGSINTLPNKVIFFSTLISVQPQACVSMGLFAVDLEEGVRVCQGKNPITGYTEEYAEVRWANSPAFREQTWNSPWSPELLHCGRVILIFSCACDPMKPYLENADLHVCEEFSLLPWIKAAIEDESYYCFHSDF